MKRVLILTRFFPPEQGAAQERVRFFAERIGQQGHTVSVYTTYPSYPDYRHHTQPDVGATSYTLYRFWAPGWGRSWRALTELWFAARVTVQLLLSKKPDILIVSSPPFFLALVAVCVRYIRRLPYIVDVRDLYPDSLVHVGWINATHPLSRLLFTLEKRVYEQAKGVIAISAHMKKTILAKAPTAVVSTIYNGLDYTQYRQYETAVQITPPFVHSDKKTVIYIGNFGRVYDFMTILQAAKQLQKTAWQFVFVGAGQQQKDMEQYIREQGIENAFLLPMVGMEQIPSYVKAADVGIVSLKDIPLAQGSIPTKIFEYIAAELPVLARVYGEAQEYFDGYITPFSTAEDIVAFLMKPLPKQQPFIERFDREHGLQTLLSIV